MIVRNLEARLVDQSLAEQQDIQVQGARAPAFGLAFTALRQFDALQGIEQRQRLEVGLQCRNRVDVAWLVGGPERVAGIERGDCSQPATWQLGQRLQGTAQLLLGSARLLPRPM